jgi:hypothetical protein
MFTKISHSSFGSRVAAGLVICVSITFGSLNHALTHMQTWV